MLFLSYTYYGAPQIVSQDDNSIIYRVNLESYIRTYTRKYHNPAPKKLDIKSKKIVSVVTYLHLNLKLVEVGFSPAIKDGTRRSVGGGCHFKIFKKQIRYNHNFLFIKKL